jgi:hypothetical protein
MWRSSFLTGKITRLACATGCSWLLLLACSEAPYKVPDDRPPVVRFTYPADGTVVGRTLPVVVEATDDETVTEVRFFFDDALAYKDYEPPYQWWIRPAPETSSHCIIARARDAWGNCGTSDTLTIRFGWSCVYWDYNQYWVGDLLWLRLRSDSTWVYLQLELDSFIDEDETRAEASIVYVYLDTDCLPSTGKPVEEIGAEYRMLLLWQFELCDGLYAHELLRWNAQSLLWEYWFDPPLIQIAQKRPILRAAIPLAKIDQPDSLDIVVTSAVYKVGLFEDRMPNLPERCYRCRIDRLYVGDDF